LKQAIQLLCLAFVLSPPLATAKDPSDDWVDRLVKIEKHIQEGRYRKAASRALRFEEEMLGSIIDGPRVPEFLGKLAALHAIALAGRGETDHAAWKWYMALEFFPEIEKIVLADYGEAGEKLKNNLGVPDANILMNDYGEAIVSPPKVKVKPKPQFPAVQREAGARCRLMVKVVIGPDGRPYGPEIINSDGRPTLVYTTLLALRRWVFEPASTESGPISTTYFLNVKFGG